MSPKSNSKNHNQDCLTSAHFLPVLSPFVSSYFKFNPTMASIKKYFPLYLIFAAAAAAFCLYTSPCLAELPRFEQPIKDDNSLSFLVVGDWGRKGLYNQSEVARQMGIVGETMKIDFVISTGDNFYEDGLMGINDPAFLQSFVDMYTAPSLQKQWYNVLGNHDYRGDVEAQLSPLLAKLDGRWLCSRSYIVDTELAEFFFVDTTPFVDKYFTHPGHHTFDWRGVLPRKAYLKNLLQDVDSALKNSKAKWKIVVGHHTIKSAGQHGATHEVKKRLLPILKENDVDLYINGHDHCLEHIIDTKSGIHFLTSGGGSKAWDGVIKKLKPAEKLELYYDGQGFLSIEITAGEAELVYYDVAGKVLHKWTLSKTL